MFTKKFIYLTILVFALLILSACGQVSVGIETPRSSEQAPGQGSIIEVSQTPEQTEVAAGETRQPTSTPEPSPYWVEVQDPQFGVRYAVPCFWLVNFPPDYGPGSGAQSYSIRNYPDEYVLTFPRGQGVWEAGGIKIDMNFMDSATWGIAPGASLMDFVNGLYPPDSETRLVSMEELEINGQPALLVETNDTFGTGQFYLMAVSETIYLMFVPNPEAVANSDVQAILNSIAISSDISVQVPTFQPGPPPEGLAASCLENPTEPNKFSEIPPEPDCQAVTPDKPEWTACNVQLGIQSRNLSALLGTMVDPFQIGYWGSEGRMDSPQAILEELQSVRLPQDPSIAPTFTVNRDLFPPLNGQDPEVLLGPDVKPVQVIYSEGWGEDRDGSALLYFIENEAGERKWYGMIFSEAHFDKPAQSNTTCGVHSFSSLGYLTQAIQTGLSRGDIGTLQYENFIHDPIVVGIWGSESMTEPALEFSSMLANQFLPLDPSGLTFTTDPVEFPSLGGMPRNTLLGSDVNVARVIYSEGWGSDGLGAALIYLAQDDCQGYYWHGLIFSPQHFDQ